MNFHLHYYLVLYVNIHCMPIFQKKKRSQNKDWWDLKSRKSMQPEPGNLLRVESSQVCRGC